MYDDEIATLATDDADLPIGRLTVSAAPFEVLPRLSSAAMDALRRDYALSRVRAAEVPATGDEIGRSRPVGGTSAGIFTGRGVAGRFGNMHPGHLQRSRMGFLYRDLRCPCRPERRSAGGLRGPRIGHDGSSGSGAVLRCRFPARELRPAAVSWEPVNGGREWNHAD